MMKKTMGLSSKIETETVKGMWKWCRIQKIGKKKKIEEKLKSKRQFSIGMFACTFVLVYNVHFSLLYYNQNYPLAISLSTIF